MADRLRYGRMADRLMGGKGARTMDRSMDHSMEVPGHGARLPAKVLRKAPLLHVARRDACAGSPPIRCERWPCPGSRRNRDREAGTHWRCVCQPLSGRGERCSRVRGPVRQPTDVAVALGRELGLKVDLRQRNGLAGRSKHQQAVQADQRETLGWRIRPLGVCMLWARA